MGVHFDKRATRKGILMPAMIARSGLSFDRDFIAPMTGRTGSYLWCELTTRPAWHRGRAQSDDQRLDLISDRLRAAANRGVLNPTDILHVGIEDGQLLLNAKVLTLVSLKRTIKNRASFDVPGIDIFGHQLTVRIHRMLSYDQVFVTTCGGRII